MLYTNYRESCVVIYMLKNHGAVEFKDVLESLDPKIFFVKIFFVSDIWI